MYILYILYVLVLYDFTLIFIFSVTFGEIFRLIRSVYSNGKFNTTSTPSIMITAYEKCWKSSKGAFSLVHLRLRSRKPLIFPPVSHFITSRTILLLVKTLCAGPLRCTTCMRLGIHTALGDASKIARVSKALRKDREQGH